MQNFHVLIRGLLSIVGRVRWTRIAVRLPEEIASGDQGYPDWTRAKRNHTATEVADYRGTIN